jgi:subtilisin family serine protease
LLLIDFKKTKGKNMKYTSLSMLLIAILMISSQAFSNPLFAGGSSYPAVQSFDGALGDEDSVNYFNKNPEADGVEGMSVDKVYSELPLEMDVEPIIVAVVDGGVDVNHEDLQGKIWTNEDEVPGDGIDNDGNGYVDDVHGWNFIGGADGKSIDDETLEVTREYVRYMQKLEKGVELTDEEKEYYAGIEKEFKKNKALSNAAVALMGPIAEQIAEMKKVLEEKAGITDYSDESLKSYEGLDEDVLYAVSYLRLINNIIESTTLPGAYTNYYKRQADYWYNEDLNARQEIVGDNPSDFSNLIYGNSDVKGPDA